MCGQFGIMTNTSHVHTADDFLADAFVASMLRGVDSSGIVNIDTKKNEYNLHKLPVCGMHFVGDPTVKRYMAYATGVKQITMAHVRAATVGKVTMGNAHPFLIDTDDNTLIGTHNGTLTGWANKPSARYYDVDSEWALSRIESEGVDAFKEFNGAYSFVWWQGKDKDVLNMARNKERPMSVAFLKNGGMAYASEPGMLFWLLERNNLFMDGKIILLDEGKHYKFNVSNPKEFTSEELPKAASTVTTYYPQSTYSRNTTTTYRKTTVDAVDEMLKEIALSEAAVPLEDTENEDDREFQFPQAYDSEIAAARQYGWFDTEGEFTPLQVDGAGNTRGIIETYGTEFDAIIRGDFTNIYSMNDIWKVTILGVQDDDKEIVMVCSRPSKTISVQDLVEGA